MVRARPILASLFPGLISNLAAAQVYVSRSGSDGNTGEQALPVKTLSGTRCLIEHGCGTAAMTGYRSIVTLQPRAMVFAGKM